MLVPLRFTLLPPDCGTLPVANRPTFPSNCCRNEDSLPGDGVVRATTVTGWLSSLVLRSMPRSTPAWSKVSATTSWSRIRLVAAICGRVTSEM